MSQGRQPWRAVFFALAAVAIVAGVAWALLASRFFVVRSVQVKGNHLIGPAQVVAASGIQLGVPLLRVDSTQVAGRVERIRQVQSATVSRGWPDSVTITVHERIPALAVATGSGYQLIDEHGVAVEAAASPPRGMPVFQPSGPAPLGSLRGSPAVYAAAVVLRELPASLAGSVRDVQAPSAAEVTLKLADGVTIVWGGTDRPKAKAAELTLLMRTDAHSYDVSAPLTAVSSG